MIGITETHIIESLEPIEPVEPLLEEPSLEPPPLESFLEPVEEPFIEPPLEPFLEPVEEPFLEPVEEPFEPSLEEEYLGLPQIHIPPINIPPININLENPELAIIHHANTHGHYAQNWNRNNEKIIDRWMENLNQNSYIYEIVSEKCARIHSRLQILLLIFNSFLAIISYLQLNTDNNTDNNTEINTYKYLMVILSSFVTLVVNFQRIKKYENKANIFSSISLELSALTLIILSQIEIPYEMRQDFNIYLPEIRQKYYSLLRKLPNMDQHDYDKAFEKYKLFNLTQCKQNFVHQFAKEKNNNLLLQIQTSP